MHFRTLLWVAAWLVTLAPTPAQADVFAGGSLGVGSSLTGKADARMQSTIYLRGDVGRGFTLGGEVAGTFEGYTGAYACAPESGVQVSGTVPDVAALCLWPTLAVHVVAGVSAQPQPNTRLSLQVGAGPAVVWWSWGSGRSAHEWQLSSLVRATYVVRVGRGWAGEWWLGLALEERAVGVGDARSMATVGLVLEGR